jgi:YhcG PDDEXK nuclease domain/DUF1016 N-terminal domain
MLVLPQRRDERDEAQGNYNAMMKSQAFAQECPKLQIGQQSAAQLPWFHIVTLITKVVDQAPREWYARQALATQILKDPYHFDFLGLGDEAHERDIENSLIRHITRFLLELGAGFAFVGRQFRLEAELSRDLQEPLRPAVDE